MSEAKRYPSADGSCVLEVRNDAAYVIDKQGTEFARIEFAGECVAAAVANAQSHVALALRNLLFTHTYMLARQNGWQKQAVGNATTSPPTSLHFQEPEDSRYPPTSLIRTMPDGQKHTVWPK